MKDNKYNDVEKNLRELKEDFKLNSKTHKNAKANIMEGIKPKRNFIRYMPAMAATILLVISVMATSVLAFPEMAKKYAPKIPIVKELSEKDEEILDVAKEKEDITKEKENIENELNKEKEETEAKDEKIHKLEEEVDELKMKIKEIADEEIKEVETSENTDEALNLELQTVVVEFVKEMYKGNYKKAADYCTKDFGDFVKNNPEDIILRGEDTVIFTQITNIAETENGDYLVFLRLNDAIKEADHQLNFEIIKVDGEYKISFAGLDA